jgi:integrase/recombinase XerD
MSKLSQELDRYLIIRRSFGSDLGTAARVLRRFIAFVEGQGTDHISTDLFLRWKKVFGKAHQQTWAARLGMIRLFAQWLQVLDPTHEVPPKGLIPSRLRRPKPYIYSVEEIKKILKEAASLPSMSGIRALTFSTLFGLIAVTGLRISEALALDNDDVDLETGVLTIRRGKAGKARLVPITDSVIKHLKAYIRERDRIVGFVPQSFFVTEEGTRPDDCSARYNFAIVCRRIGLRSPQPFLRHGRGPRIHDLRHTFAARTMVGWYRDGKDAAREMIKLTNYLGHATPAHTYWYIEAVPELLELASQRVTGALAGEVR